MRERTASRSSPSTATARWATSTCSASASRPSSATPTCSTPSTSPASRCTRSTAASDDPIVHRGRARGVQPRADRRLRRRGRARRRRGDRARDLRGRPRVEGRGPPGRPRSSCCAGSPPARTSTSRSSTTSPTPPTAPSRRSCPTSPGIPFRVRKHTLMDLDQWPYPAKPLVPLAETVHERFSVEIFRGCTRGCRFCQAGMITRPGPRALDRDDRRDGRERHPDVRLRGGRPALAVERRPQRDRRGRQGPRRPLRGPERLAVAARRPASTPSTSRWPTSSPATAGVRA